jgi:hypothetical protein
MGARETFVDQDREAQLVGLLDGERQRVIRVEPPVDLRPLQDVLRCCTRRFVVQEPDAFNSDHSTSVSQAVRN